MPITIQYSPFQIAGQLAMQAGRGAYWERARARDMALIAQQQAAAAHGADIAAARAAQQIEAEKQQRVFGLQQAMAAQMAQQRQAILTDAERTQRQQLESAVMQAEQSGIYDPRQVAQMRIFANLGNDRAVQEILGQLPRPPREPEISVGEQERRRQVEAVQTAVQARIEPLQRRIALLDEYFDRFTPQARAGIAEKTIVPSPEYVKKTAEREKLQQQIDLIQAAEQPRLEALEFGITIPQQIAMEQREETAETRAETWSQRRLLAAQIQPLQDAIKVEMRKLTDPKSRILMDESNIQAIQTRIDNLNKQIISLISGQSQPISPSAPDSDAPKGAGLFEGAPWTSKETGRRWLWKDGKWVEQ